MLIKGLGTGNFKAFPSINYSVLTGAPRPRGPRAGSARLREAPAASPTGFPGHAELGPRSVSKPVSVRRTGRRPSPCRQPVQTPHGEQQAPGRHFLL